MGSPLTRRGFEQLIAGDLEWLAAQPRSLERDHIAALLRESVDRYYPKPADPTVRPSAMLCKEHGGYGFSSDCVACRDFQAHQ